MTFLHEQRMASLPPDFAADDFPSGDPLHEVRLVKLSQPLEPVLSVDQAFCALLLRALFRHRRHGERLIRADAPLRAESVGSTRQSTPFTMR